MKEPPTNSSRSSGEGGGFSGCGSNPQRPSYPRQTLHRVSRGWHFTHRNADSTGQLLQQVSHEVCVRGNNAIYVTDIGQLEDFADQLVLVDPLGLIDHTKQLDELLDPELA